MLKKIAALCLIVVLAISLAAIGCTQFSHGSDDFLSGGGTGDVNGSADSEDDNINSLVAGNWLTVVNLTEYFMSDEFGEELHEAMELVEFSGDLELVLQFGFSLDGTYRVSFDERRIAEDLNTWAEYAINYLIEANADALGEAYEEFMDAYSRETGSSYIDDFMDFYGNVFSLELISSFLDAAAGPGVFEIYNDRLYFDGGPDYVTFEASESTLAFVYGSNPAFNAMYSLPLTLTRVRDISVIVNGTLLPLDQPPVVVDGITLVPVRDICVALGADVEWDQPSQTITAVRGELTVTAQIDSNELLRNGESVPLGTPVQVIDGKTLVPVRAIAECFGAEVDWDQATQTIIITG